MKKLAIHIFANFYYIFKNLGKIAKKEDTIHCIHSFMSISGAKAYDKIVKRKMQLTTFTVIIMCNIRSKS